MPDPSILQTFPTPASAPFVIEHTSDEFTSLCPMTGHPDFGSVTLRYQPAPPPKDSPSPNTSPGGCVELKSLKLYYQAFRNEGIFYEAATNTIRDHLVERLNPTWLQIITRWKGRGGIRSTIRAHHGNIPTHYLND